MIDTLSERFHLLMGSQVRRRRMNLYQGIILRPLGIIDASLPVVYSGCSFFRQCLKRPVDWICIDSRVKSSCSKAFPALLGVSLLTVTCHQVYYSIRRYPLDATTRMPTLHTFFDTLDGYT